MVFVKFHNMNRKKIFLMSPLNSNKLKNFHSTSQNNITITVHKCSVLFSSFFNLCTVYFTKNVCSFFLFFLFYMLCSTMFKFFSFFFSVPFSLSSSFFLFVFFFLFFSFFFFFFIINCSFNVPFFSTLYLPLCLYLNTITIGSLPSLFNFSL